MFFCALVDVIQNNPPHLHTVFFGHRYNTHHVRTGHLVVLKQTLATIVYLF